MPDNDTLDPTQPDGQDDASQGPATGEVILDHDIERELKDSYLTYAMSTIMDRALPDVRDGLKPSQRRILVAMNDLKLRPGRKHLKCAKICGNTSGDYHPHGEAVIYPTLVGLAQKWRMRVPLVDPQGNFGSVDGDPPAAMRYTEARMTHAAVDMLADLDLDTVDFQSNYDDRLQEPMVLPGRFPNLLINGSVGIAVGMATSMPPHNPVEVFDSIIRLIEKPDLALGDLIQDVKDAEGKIIRHGLKGPDFPTGGTICGRAGIIEAYATGRGRLSVRGTCHIEQVGKDREQIVIDEIPYMVSQGNLVEKIVEGVKEERITEVADVRNESGRNAQSRVVIELKRGADARVVENQLYQFTPLQQTFSIHNIALVNRRPKTLTVLELLRHYVEHRVDVIRRRTAHLLHEAKKKAHTLEGLIYAVCDIDEVIRIIRASRSREQAIEQLMARRFRLAPDHPQRSKIPQRLITRWDAAMNEPAGGIALTRKQAEAIGELRLIRLVGLEIEKIVADYTAIVAEIEGYETILASRDEQLAIVKADCEEMRTRYGASPKAVRLTRIEDKDSGDINIEALIQEEDMVVTISRNGYCKRVSASTYRQQGRGGKGIRAGEARDEDFIQHLLLASTHDDLLCFTNTGRVFKIKVYELPELSRASRGRAMVNLLNLRDGESPCAFLAIRDFESKSKFLTFISRGGIVKRTPLKEYRNVHQGGLIAVGLKEDDTLLDVTLTDGSDDLLLVTAHGSAIRFSEQDVRLMGRPAAGVKGIELSDDDAVVGCIVVPMAPDVDGDLMTVDPTLALLTITSNGYGKRTPVDEYRVQPEEGKLRSQSRGGKGRRDIDTGDRNGLSVAALGVHESDDVVVVSRHGQLVRLPASSIRECGRGSKGVRVVRLNEGDAAVAAARVAEE